MKTNKKREIRRDDIFDTQNNKKKDNKDEQRRDHFW